MDYGGDGVGWPPPRWPPPESNKRPPNWGWKQQQQQQRNQVHNRGGRMMGGGGGGGKRGAGAGYPKRGGRGGGGGYPKRGRFDFGSSTSRAVWRRPPPVGGGGKEEELLLSRIRAHNQQLEEAKQEFARRAEVENKVSELKRKLCWRSSFETWADDASSLPLPLPVAVPLEEEPPSATAAAVAAEEAAVAAIAATSNPPRTTGIGGRGQEREPRRTEKDHVEQHVEAIVSNLKSVILRKNKSWLRRLIDEGTSRSAKSVIMSQLVREHRTAIAEQLNAERFGRREEDEGDETEVTSVDLESLPETLISRIEEMIKNERPELCADADRDEDEDVEIQEVPVPPKPPVTVVDLQSDDDDDDVAVEEEPPGGREPEPDALLRLRELAGEEKLMFEELQALDGSRARILARLEALRAVRVQLIGGNI